MTLEAPAATEDIDLSGAPTGSRLSKDLDDVEEAASLMSGVKADLVDWSAFARPAESVLVGLLLVVMVLRGLHLTSRVMHSIHSLTVPGPAECAKRLNPATEPSGLE